MPDIVIGDGHPLFVDLLSAVLSERGHRIVGTYSSAPELVAGVRETAPDICLADHRSLAGGDPHRLLVDLVAASGDHTRIVAVSVAAEGADAESAAALGVHGLLDKRCSLDTLLSGVRRVIAGETVTEVATRTPAGATGDGAEIRRLAGALTTREREILALLVRGATTATMVGELGISVMTVRSHVRSLLWKLGAHSRLEAASLAVRHHLLSNGAAEDSRAG